MKKNPNVLIAAGTGTAVAAAIWSVGFAAGRSLAPAAQTRPAGHELVVSPRNLTGPTTRLLGAIAADKCRADDSSVTYNQGSTFGYMDPRTGGLVEQIKRTVDLTLPKTGDDFGVSVDMTTKRLPDGKTEGDVSRLVVTKEGNLGPILTGVEVDVSNGAETVTSFGTITVGGQTASTEEVVSPDKIEWGPLSVKYQGPQYTSAISNPHEIGALENQVFATIPGLLKLADAVPRDPNC